MSDALFSAVQLTGTARAGYRLHALEVFNWGTFDSRVWRLTGSGGGIQKFRGPGSSPFATWLEFPEVAQRYERGGPQ